jgi:radical SAM protein with 4Fe4S-binding SPASM domain
MTSVRTRFRRGVRALNRRLLDLSYRLNLPVVLGGPIALMVEPSAACNLRCPLCPTGTRVTEREAVTLSAEDFERALGWFRYTLQSIAFWNYGEPFLNRELARMVAVASRAGITTQISTNGHFLDRDATDELFRAGLTRLIVSVDTPHRDVYARYRVGGDFDTVVRNFRHAVERRDVLGASTQIVAQYMLMRDSEDVESIVNHGRELGADRIEVKTIGIGSATERPTEADWAFLPEKEEFNRYVSRDDMRAKVHWDDARCSYIWRRMVLNADGTCVPCCRDQLAQFKLGSINEGRTLVSVWNSRGYRAYRRSIRETQKSEIMCQRCPELVHREVDPGVVYDSQ